MKSNGHGGHGDGEYLSRQFGIPAIDLAEFVIADEIAALIPADLAKRCSAMPITRTSDGMLIVAMADPDDLAARELLTAASGLEIEVVVASRVSIVLDPFRVAHAACCRRTQP